MLSPRTNKRIAAAIAVLGVLAGGAYWVTASKMTPADSDTPTDSETEVAKAVSVLPPGTEEAWLAYVDRRIAATLTRRGRTVEVSSLVPQIQQEFVSINTPYKIDCITVTDIEDQPRHAPPTGGGRMLPIFADVTFGYGDDSTTAFILGAVGPGVEDAPQLVVHPKSIAATKLYGTLCRRISDGVQAIMAPDTGTPAQ